MDNSNNSILPTKKDVNSDTTNNYIQESENNSGSLNLPVSDKFSKQQEGSWNEYLKNTSINKGTREGIQDVKVPISNYKLKQNNIENNQQRVYNINNESGSGINGYNKNEQTGIEKIYKQENGRKQGERRDRVDTRAKESIMGSKNENDATQFYEEYEQQARANNITNITKEQQLVKQFAKSRYNKEIIHFDDSETKFGGGLSKTDDYSVFFGKNAVDTYGDSFLLGHEIGEDMLKYHSDKVGNTYNELKEKIQNDDNFGDVFLDYIFDIDSDLKNIYIEHPELVAKELICDTLGFMQNDNELGNNLPHKDIPDIWVNKLDNNLLTEIKETLKGYHDDIYKDSSKDKITRHETIQDIKLPISQKTQADINLKKFKQDNNIRNDILTERTVPTSENVQEEKVAKILSKSPNKVKESDRKWAIFQANILDKGIVFEELSHKTKNRELQGKWDYTLSATARGQNAIGNARYEFDSNTKKQKKISKSLEEIRTEVGENIENFSNYMYHQLNIDRMTLEERFSGDTGINYERRNVIKNKPVFGETVTADISQKIVKELEQKYPKFKEYAQDVYDFLNANKAELVKNGVISQNLSDHMSEMYPHYIPIGRVNTKGNAINVPLDTGKTGVNSPIKSAKGGSSDILPLFDTIAQRTLQTYRASARNNFGVELKNTLNTVASIEKVNVDNIIDTMGETVEEQRLLQEGNNGKNPTFTVFENGEKITYEITKDMYDALKPVGDSSILGKTIKPLNKISNFRRGVLTEYNPLFMITNAIKDAQDVLINSQHSAKTYSKFPEAYTQIIKKGYWYQEYVQNGGEQNSYFNANDSIFESDVKQSKTKSALRIPLDAISNINNVIELAPRLSEYIASRELGRSIETSMLDASRVTTNFKAGGDVTKFVNRNGATFLNASVQGMMQQIRNITEANTKGLKGYAVLATKYAVAGLPALILNNLVWRDDEDYDELQDYVKDNYYCIAKYGDGKFIRIPKGRMLSTIQTMVTNVSDYITKDKEINIDNFASDFWEDINSIMDNVAPNNPLDNNVISPIIQVISNTSWYGEDIVPSRLQDKPKAEQYDETTDSLSIWLGQKLNISPYKINYLLDQYGGGISDVALPAMTKQAENNPIEDKFTTDSVMKSKYAGNFFETADKLKINANSSNATDEDKIKYKYISSIQSDLSDLYTKKREVQCSNASDKDKKTQLKEFQKQINEIAKNGIESLDNLKVTNNIATIGSNQYYKLTNLKTNEKEWKELSAEEKEKSKNISLKTYADYKEKIALETIKQRKNKTINKQDGQLKSKDKIQILLDSKYSNSEKTAIYENYIRTKPKEDEVDLFKILKQSNINIEEYLKYEQQDFKSDKEDDGTTKGKPVSNSKQEKVYNYVNSMKITREQKLILLGSQYKLDNSERTELANLINKLPNQTKDEKMKIYEKMKGFTVYKNGTVSW